MTDDYSTARSMILMVTSRAQQALQALNHADGTPIYSESEEDSRRQQILATFTQALDQELASGREQRDEAQQELARLTHRTALDRLSDAELGRAGLLRPFVAEDAEQLPLSLLQERLTGALAGGDRVAAFLWARYARGRLRQEEGKPGTQNLQERAQLGEAIRALEAQLIDPGETRKQEQAQATVAGYRDLELAAGQARLKVQGGHSSMEEQLRARMGLQPLA